MPQVMQGHGPNRNKVVVSLCDFSGNWPRPWNEAGFTVLHYDLKHGDDVTGLLASSVRSDIRRVLGSRIEDVLGTPWVDLLVFEIVMVLAAPPCTDFTISGAQYWPAKDADGRTAASLRVLDACVRLAEELSPAAWALENPVGRIPKLRPALGRPNYYFQPHEYAHRARPEQERERYTKRTGMWGPHARPLTDGELHSAFPVDFLPPLGPVRVCAQGSWLQKLGGKSERTKELRSVTPVGFSRAFCTANRMS